MKRIALFLLFAVFSGYAVDAQTSCGAKHRAFKTPSKGNTPKTIKRLGSDPQFIPLRHLSSHEAMYKGIKALNKNPRYKKEINALFRAAGYTGVTDPDFVSANLHKTTIPFGTIGMLGDGQHTYLYSILTLTGEQRIKCWKIDGVNGGCDFYIMDECGNAFVRTGGPAIWGEKKDESAPVAAPVAAVEQPAAEPATVYVEAPKKETDLKLNIYARYRYNACECCNPKAVYNPVIWKEKQMLVEEKQYNNINNVSGATEKETVTKDVYVEVDKATYKKMEKMKKKEAKDKEKAAKKMQKKAEKEAAKTEKVSDKPQSSRSAQ